MTEILEALPTKAGARKHTARPAKQLVDDSSITRSSGNVFADIGVAFPLIEAKKIDLVIEINQKLQLMGKTQLERSRVLGVDQSTISNLERYELARYSIGRLMRYAESLGIQF